MARSDLYRPLLFIGASIAAASAIWTGYTVRPQPAPVDEDRPATHPISQAVFVEDRLWMLHDDGAMLSLKQTDPQPEKLVTDGKVISMCRSSGKLITLVVEGGKRWKLRQHSTSGWKDIASIPIRSDNLAAFACAPDSSRMIVATTRHLFQIDGQRVKTSLLKPELKPPFDLSTALINGDSIWVGFNVGEWGGGLRRINLGSGATETVEYNRSGKLCSGPLNTECDPVNGIVPSLSNSSCVIAAVGLDHMIAHGRIVELCDKSVRRVYFKPLAPQPPHGEIDDGEPSSTVPFYGLARVGQTIWALGTDGLYRFDGAAQPQFRPLPQFENKGGYGVSFAVQGIVLVMTDVNARRSLSGAVPIMAAR